MYRIFGFNWAKVQGSGGQVTIPTGIDSDLNIYSQKTKKGCQMPEMNSLRTDLSHLYT